MVMMAVHISSAALIVMAAACSSLPVLLASMTSGILDAAVKAKQNCHHSLMLHEYVMSTDNALQLQAECTLTVLFFACMLRNMTACPYALRHLTQLSESGVHAAVPASLTVLPGLAVTILRRPGPLCRREWLH